MIKSEFFGSHHGTIDELKEVLTSKHLKMVKCFTRSLWIIEKIEVINRDYFIGLDKHNMKVIKLPDDVAEEKFAEDAFSRYPSLDYFLGKRKSQFDDSKEEYKKRLVLLEKYDTKNYDIGDLRFILVEYCDGDKVIIFLTRDTGPLGTIIGIHSEESYIIEIFNNIFNTIWEIALPAPILARYVFSWTKIPGTDDMRLKEFLGKKYHIDWVYTAGVAKSEDGKTISMSKEDTTLSLTLINEDSEVILKIDSIETDKLVAKKKKGELKIYLASNTKYAAVDPRDSEIPTIQRHIKRWR